MQMLGKPIPSWIMEMISNEPWAARVYDESIKNKASYERFLEAMVIHLYSITRTYRVRCQEYAEFSLLDSPYTKEKVNDPPF